MAEMIILVICIALIVFCFWTFHTQGGLKKGGMKQQPIPDNVQKEFYEFARELLAVEGIFIQECQVTRLEPLEEAIPYDDGEFKLFRADFNIVPESAVVNSSGITLTSKELFEKAGLHDDLAVSFFQAGEEVYEIVFMPLKRVSIQGYRNYIENRYRNLKDWVPMDEYSFLAGNNKFCLWSNLEGKEPLEGAEYRRKKAEGEMAYSAQYIGIFETGDIEIDSWAQFEKKRELVYRIVGKSYKVETLRGICVGSTVEQLKEKYPRDLSYVKDLDGLGPAYGYIPDDGSSRYIAFLTDNGVIVQMILGDGFGERPFTVSRGYVDQDIPWIEVDYSEKLTEKYARAAYLGQHKADLDVRHVFNTFAANHFDLVSIEQKGKYPEHSLDNSQTYFVICHGNEPGTKIYAEARLQQVTIDAFAKDTAIWVVTSYRSQKKRV